RYEDYDTQAEVPAGFLRNPVNNRSVITFGFEVDPIYSVVLKLDFQNFRNRAGTGINQWNFGIGYQF
ncbi:MAG: porin, partial [Vicinamibacteria bacterium]